jgi:hypothetical protein
MRPESVFAALPREGLFHEAPRSKSGQSQWFRSAAGHAEHELARFLRGALSPPRLGIFTMRTDLARRNFGNAGNFTPTGFVGLPRLRGNGVALFGRLGRTSGPKEKRQPDVGGGCFNSGHQRHVVDPFDVAVRTAPPRTGQVTMGGSCSTTLEWPRCGGEPASR